jgi:hypothetical protein
MSLTFIGKYLLLEGVVIGVNGGMRWVTGKEIGTATDLKFPKII